jgi:hypothetical protein
MRDQAAGNRYLPGTLGYAGGFLGPLALGAVLDLLDGASVLEWGVAFGHVTVALLLEAFAFAWLGPADLAGDRSVAAAAVPPPKPSLSQPRLTHRQADMIQAGRDVATLESFRRRCEPTGPWSLQFGGLPHSGRRGAKQGFSVVAEVRVDQVRQ